MQVQGSCHCGQVQYEAEIDPQKVVLCHCTDCQTLTGSAYRVSVPAPAATFKLLSGRFTEYVKTADSGSRRAHGFCPVCGTPMYSRAEVDHPISYTLRVGSMQQKAQLPPAKRIWCKSALQWSQDVSAIPGHPGE